MPGAGSADQRRIQRARAVLALRSSAATGVAPDLPGAPQPLGPVGDHAVLRSERAGILGEGALLPVGPLVETAPAEAVKMLAHELRQPLGAITNLAGAALNAIEAQAASLKRLQDLLVAIRKEAQRAADIVRSATEPANGGPEAGAGDVLEAIDAVIARLRPALAETVVDLEFERPATVPAVRGSQTLLEQVLHNVIANAVEEMVNVPLWTRRLTVRVAQEPAGTVRVDIGDTGRGIPESLGARIFEPLVSGKATGRGLGLHVVRTLLQRVGGAIEARPCEGRGTVFSIQLAPAQ